jgi:signal transduction histidine kinase
MDAVHATTKREAPVLATPVVLQTQSLLIPDTGLSMADLYSEIGPEKRAIFEAAGISAAMGVPLAVAGNTFGAMTFFAVRARHFESTDLALAQEVAGRVAAALEHARVHRIAREAIAARDEFLVLVAHELRTPLAAMQLVTDALLRSARREGDLREQKKSEAVAIQVRRFCGLVERVIEAMNIRAEGVTLVLGVCDLRALVDRAIASTRDRAQRAGCSVSSNVEPVVCRADAARLYGVVVALLDNAIKFGAGKPIRLATRVLDRFVELSIADQGMGIPPDRLSAVFSPFERAVPKEHFGGLGLGLFMAKAVVEAHGGSITIHSRIGEGSTVAIRLPR